MGDDKRREFGERRQLCVIRAAGCDGRVGIAQAGHIVERFAGGAVGIADPTAAIAEGVAEGLGVDRRIILA